MDRLTPEQRHRCMAAIRSRNTKPEMLVRRYLHACGLRFRVNVRRLPGTPDIVLRKYKTVIRVQGCFWHGHACQGERMPKTNAAYWAAKIQRNRERDEENRQQLLNFGWNVITLWECELRPARREQTLRALLATLDHLFLVNAGLRKPSAHDYSQSENSLPLAAEDETEYG